MREAFSINKGLVEGDFDLNSRQARAVREWEGQLSESLQSFVERGEAADQIFPELKGFRPGQDKEPIRRLVERIGTDIEWIKQKYSEMVPAEFPPSQIVGRTWASFRWLQVHLIAAVEYFSVYGPGINKTNRETLENERTDLNYLVLATLAGGLATHDEALARRFRIYAQTEYWSMADTPETSNPHAHPDDKPQTARSSPVSFRAFGASARV